MKQFILSVCLVVWWGNLMAQVTLESCYMHARENYPLIRQYDLISKSETYNLSNASKGYLPQLSIDLQASYQSDVTKIPINLPGVYIDGLPKDHYRASVQLQQSIWDGGQIRSQRRVLEQKAKVEAAELETNMYTLRDRINQLYFGILLLDEQLLQNELLQEQLNRNLHQVDKYVLNGIANNADVDAVKVEILNAKQQHINLDYTRNAYVKMLGYMTAQKYGPETTFSKPQINNEYSASDCMNRPELLLFSAKLEQLDWKEKALTSGYTPRVGMFLQGAYGNPGLNILEDKFKFFYVAGIRISWDIGKLYTSRNDRQLLEMNRQFVETERNMFLYNTHLQKTEVERVLQSLEKQMKDDDEIIQLRNRIRMAAEAKVANGTMSVLDMLREVNKESQAKVSKALHEMQWLQTLHKLKYIINQ